MKLSAVITGQQLVSVVTESDHAITLALHDQQIGEVAQVTITADVTVDGVRVPSLMIIVNDRRTNGRKVTRSAS
jgi:hypothetical protein